MQIRLTQHARDDWTVVCGEKYHARLSSDEAAWIVMNLMMDLQPRLKLGTVQDDMARASRMRHADYAIDSMSEIVRCLRDDQRLARVGPLEND